ncbi:MAG TPA: sodium-dependent transporter [Clostridiales bacterium]|nr:sodium-dependent transporter [Clostridiales bacterium]
MAREKFKSRLGFILLSAGCAIGIGNVWRFPYVAGEHGGGAFVLFYLFFLVILGVPLTVMEFAIGRGSKKSIARSYYVLEKKGQKWHWHGYVAMAGNFLLMMFYTSVAGWMLNYFYKMITGEFVGTDSGGVAVKFDEMLSNPIEAVLWMLLIVVIGFLVCSIGLQKGVERITKVMMVLLLFIMVGIAINCILTPGGTEGLKFFLLPDFDRMYQSGVVDTIVAAMNQAFFTLSLGAGSMMIFGSYLDRDRSLVGESINVAALDTFVAIVSGLIIFPSCFAFNVSPDSGPSLVFVTLPNIFNAMEGGQIWGGLFFLFMSFAAISTVIAVFENIISFGMDLWNWSRKKSAAINLVLVPVLSLPCALGFNVFSGFKPFGEGSTVLDLEDFILSSIILPAGCLVCVLFCVSRRFGWGYDNFIKEANTGKGIKMPKWVRGYLIYVLPVIVLIVFIQGLYSKFFM